MKRFGVSHCGAISACRGRAESVSTDTAPHSRGATVCRPSSISPPRTKRSPQMKAEDYHKYDALGLADLIRRGEVRASEVCEADCIFDAASPDVRKPSEGIGFFVKKLPDQCLLRVQMRDCAKFFRAGSSPATNAAPTRAPIASLIPPHLRLDLQYPGIRSPQGDAAGLGNEAVPRDRRHRRWPRSLRAVDARGSAP